MSSGLIDRHIWFYAVFYHLYPFFNRYRLIPDDNSESNYSQLFAYLAKQNTFFEDCGPEDKNVDHFVFKTIEIASGLSTPEFENKNGRGEFNYKPLESVFSGLFGQKENKGNQVFYPVKPLHLSNVLPTQHDSGDIKSVFMLFVDELKRVQNEYQLFHLIEKYFWCVSSSKIPDISLFDEIKTTAAIATCLYRQFERGLLELDCAYDTPSEQFLLIHGDVSGIQNFIFHIPSKGAAKSLKGRSVYIGMLSDVIAKYILEELGLFETNLLYNGGGNFFILAPACQKSELADIRRKILQHLLYAHDGDVYFAIDSVTVKMADFQKFTDIWEQVKNKTNQLKKRKWSELGLETHFTEIFGPVDEGSEEKNVCRVCGSFGSKHPVHIEALEDDEKTPICTLCKSFVKLTNELRSARFIVYRKRKPSYPGKTYSSYSSIFHHFGYDVRLSEKEPASSQSDEMWYTLNDTNFLEQGCTGFVFGAYALPRGEEGQITFEELSKRAVQNGRGDQKIAHLKLDVDNLGALFKLGLEENSSISRVSVLSRMLGLYFEGYINQLIKEKEWDQYLYVVFSGGDDTYIVGTWDKVFAFAEAFYNDFRTFTGHNPFVTFSAAINIFPYQFPVIQAAGLIESALDTSKATEPSINDGKPPIKNKISFLGEIFNWEEFKQVKEIKDILENMVIQYNNQSILRKVGKSTIGFKQILKDSTKGTFRNIKFWRLAYYLREIKKIEDKRKEDYVEQLIEQYRKIVVHNLFKEENKDQIHKIMIIPAAIKWAQLATRKEGENR